MHKPTATRFFVVIGGLLFILSGLTVLVLQRGFAQVTNEAATEAPPVSDDATVLELNEQITEHRKKIEELNRQSQAFEATVRAKEKEALTLSGELSILDTQMDTTVIQLDTVQTEIEKAELEIRVLEKQITEKEKQIGEQRDRLAAILRDLYRKRQRPLLEVIVVEESFSRFFATLQNLSQLQDDVHGGLDRLTGLRRDLEITQDDLRNHRADLLQTKERLGVLRSSLDEQKNFKSDLLRDTQSSQATFDALLDDIRQESDAANAEIATLEKRVRERLGEEQGTGQDGKLGTGPLGWPMDPGRGISAYFRDPTYPFRCTKDNQRNCIGEHSAIDIRAPQGTPILAAADGYVAIARRLDWIRNDEGKILRPAYNYVTIIHGDAISTVYGHLSSVKVVEDTYVTKGQVIGLSGALPGTAGAGLWTTGPHLHFEVRKDGIPQDPLNYLP